MTIRELRELIANVDDDMRIVIEGEDTTELLEGFEACSHGEEVFVLSAE